MKKTYAVLVAVAALVFFFRVSPLWAGEEESGLSFEFKSKFQSSYIGCFGYKTDVGAVLISEATFGLPKGFYIYFWDLWGTKNSNSNEWDVYLGWSGEFLGLKFDLGAGHWDLQNQADYWNIYAEVGKEFSLNKKHKLLPYAKMEWIASVNANKEDKGGFPVTLGLRHEWQAGKVFSLPLIIKSDVRAFHDPGLFGGENIWLGKFTTQASWQVTKNFSVTLPFTDFSLPFTDVKNKDGREFAAVVGIGINLSF